MRIIKEENVEKSDYLEIILTKKDREKIENNGLIQNFKEGFNQRPLNVFIHPEENDYIYEDEEEEVE